MLNTEPRSALWRFLCTERFQAAAVASFPESVVWENSAAASVLAEFIIIIIDDGVV